MWSPRPCRAIQNPVPERGRLAQRSPTRTRFLVAAGRADRPSAEPARLDRGARARGDRGRDRVGRHAAASSGAGAADSAVLPIINDSTGQPGLDELGVLLQSSIARNIANFPGVTLVASNDEARAKQKSPDYTASVALRPSLTGIVAQIELRQGSERIWSDSAEGDAVVVLRDAADQLTGALEKQFGSARGPTPTDAARAANRYTPTQNEEALASYLKARKTPGTRRKTKPSMRRPPRPFKTPSIATDPSHSHSRA